METNGAGSMNIGIAAGLAAALLFQNPAYAGYVTYSEIASLSKNEQILYVSGVADGISAEPLDTMAAWQR